MGKNENGGQAGAFGGGAALGAAMGFGLGRVTARGEPGEELLPADTAAILDALHNITAALVTVSNQLAGIDKIATELLCLLGLMAPPPPGASDVRVLEPFKEEGETLVAKSPFTVEEYSPGRGGLIWAVIDTDSPEVDVSIRLDDLVWKFNIDEMLTQGLQAPLFPGAWLSRAEAGPPAHYCLVFSAGTERGFTYNARMGIYVTYRGSGSATLTQGRGVGWRYIG